PVMGGIDLSALTYTISPAELNEAGEVVKEAAIVELGAFIAALISFIIVAFVMFLIIKGMNSMQKKEEEAAPAAPPRQEVLLEEIRNLLAKQS
ncbi:MAG TPA: large conductance mechanosensitive channel protein MscL, partial [Hyphomonas atlantica]|nr:large conductance mechanosensitive channel protein MscL [Hyphomonas atlantica]HBH44715.1 large conductance mechanosensitive channel protein MscL [Hyphomonas atlantica]